MSYEILNDELYSEDEKKGKKDNNKKMNFKFNPIYIHISILLILGGIIFYYFSIYSPNSQNKIGSLTFVGELKNFNKSYSGNLSFYSKNFELKTKNTLIGNSKDFIVTNFSGNIYLKNQSIIFNGIAKKITYENNEINLNYKKFKLISKKKTEFKANFKNLNLQILNGKIKLDNSLNYDFKNSSLDIKNFNASINYDGTFSISGLTNEFNLRNKNKKLEIIFKNE